MCICNIPECLPFFVIICSNGDIIFQEFSPGSNGRKCTMGVYVRDLLLGQVSCNQLPICLCTSFILCCTYLGKRN